MKNLLLAFTTLLVVSGIVSINLWRDLREERQTHAALKTQLTQPHSIPLATPASATLAQSVATPPPAEAPVAPVAVAKPAPTPVENELFTQTLTATISAGAINATGAISERALRKDPEYRKAQLTQARLKLALSNPGLVETLGLSHTEADHLFEVMAEAQLKLTDEFTEVMAKSGDAAPAMATMREKAAGLEDPARAVLGEGRYAQYQEYLRNAKPALSRVSNLGYVLNGASQPLNDSQARALAAAILTESQRQEAVAASRPNTNPGVPRNVADTMSEYHKTEAESRQRVLAAVSPYLNAAQMDVLRKEDEEQSAFARQSDARRQAQSQPARGNQP